MKLNITESDLDSSGTFIIEVLFDKVDMKPEALVPIFVEDCETKLVREIELLYHSGKLEATEYMKYYRIPGTNRCSKDVAGFEVMFTKDN